MLTFQRFHDGTNALIISAFTVAAAFTTVLTSIILERLLELPPKSIGAGPRPRPSPGGSAGPTPPRSSDHHTYQMILYINDHTDRQNTKHKPKFIQANTQKLTVVP